MPVCFLFGFSFIPQKKLDTVFIMHPVSILTNVLLFILANVVSRVDGQSTTEDSDTSNNFLIAALDPLSQDSTFVPDNNLMPNNVVPDNLVPHKENLENLENVDFQDLDLSTIMGDSIFISDSKKCAGTLGKKSDGGSTSGNYRFSKDLCCLWVNH